jgi:hypothetical protein
VVFGAARAKYNPLAKTTRGVEFVTLSKTDPDYVQAKIKDVEYKSRIQGFPEDSYVTYIDLNPKSLIKAFGELVKYGIDLITQNQTDALKGIGREWYACCHRNNSRKLFVLIDVDVKREEILNDIIKKLGSNILYIAETHGGFHFIVRKNKESSKIIYEQIQPSYPYTIEVKKEVQTPIPGTMQGGFEVKLIAFNQSGIYSS